MQRQNALVSVTPMEKSTMIHTGRYDSSDKIKLPYSLLLHKITCNRTQNNSCVKSCTLIHSLMQVNIVLLQTQWSTFLPYDRGFHRQCSTSHWTNPIVPPLHGLGNNITTQNHFDTMLVLRCSLIYTVLVSLFWLTRWTKVTRYVHPRSLSKVSQTVY
jgi:hypothetical protein